MHSAVCFIQGGHPARTASSKPMRVPLSQPGLGTLLPPSRALFPELILLAPPRSLGGPSTCNKTPLSRPLGSQPETHCLLGTGRKKSTTKSPKDLDAIPALESWTLGGGRLFLGLSFHDYTPQGHGHSSCQVPCTLMVLVHQAKFHSKACFQSDRIPSPLPECLGKWADIAVAMLDRQQQAGTGKGCEFLRNGMMFLPIPQLPPPHPLFPIQAAALMVITMLAL